jgi:hypothetical protein
MRFRVGARNDNVWRAFYSGISDMIDKRLIDYSEGYRDYGDKLRDQDMELRLGDMLLILEGFLMRYSGALTGNGGGDDPADSWRVSAGSSDFDKDSALILHLIQALKLRGAYNMQP